MSKTLNDYEILKELGSGGFGTAYRAIRKSDGETIVLKIIRVDPFDRRLMNLIESEVEALKKISTPGCDSPFVVCYYDSSYDTLNDQYLIEMEFIDGKDMLDFILEQKLSQEELYYYLLLIARDVALGLKYVHDKGIIHNDVKLENIMIQKDTNIPKLIDFGLVCMLDKMDPKYKVGKECISDAGTADYIAPEVLTHISEGLRTPASDMWALGISLFAGVNKTMAYHGKTKEEVFEKIRASPAPRINTTNELLDQVVNGLLDKNPYTRLTADQVVEMVDKNIVKPPQTSQPQPEPISERTQTDKTDFPILGSSDEFPPVSIEREDFLKITDFLLL